MNEIDWSKAPEGATHYNHTGFDWYKVGSHEPSFWNGRAWAPARFWDDYKHDCIQRPTTPSWTGECLPPVGTVLETIDKGFKGGTWTKAVVLAVGKHGDGDCLIVAEVIEGQSRPGAMVASLYTGWEKSFRPIRTPEQIAADERVAAIDAMVKVCPYPGSTSTRLDCAALYDAGYRKP